MTENSGRILEALDHLDPALIEDMDGQATAKRRSTPMRVVLAAACVCALLVTAVVAAEAMGFDFVRIWGNPEEKTVYVKIRGDDSAEEWEEMGLLYEVYGSGNVKNIPLRELSPAIQEIQEQYKDEDWYTEQVSFDSWTEAEEFVGREISDNAVLEEAEYELSTIWKDREPYQEGNCIVGAFIKYGKLDSVDLRAEYKLPLPGTEDGEYTSVSVRADLYIGKDLPLNPDFGYIDNGYWTVEGQEDYLTSNGLETVILDVKMVQDEQISEGGQYHAFFFLRGVSFRVEVNYWGPEEQETVLTGLKEVLDNFK